MPLYEKASQIFGALSGSTAGLAQLATDKEIVDSELMLIRTKAQAE
jgi:hypothetical protein